MAPQNFNLETNIDEVMHLHPSSWEEQMYCAIFFVLCVDNIYIYIYLYRERERDLLFQQQTSMI